MQLLPVGSKFTLITQGKVGMGFVPDPGLKGKPNQGQVQTRGSKAAWGVEENKHQETNVEKTSKH